MYENTPMHPLTKSQQKKFDSCTSCCVCKRGFSESVVKVKDHDHFTGKFR